MLIRKLVVVGLVGFISFAANIATAEDAVGPGASSYAVDGVILADPSAPFPDSFQLSLGEGAEPRFTGLAPVETGHRDSRRSRRYELEFVAASVRGIDVSIAQRGGVGFNAQGDIERESRASELRLGRGLRMQRNQPSLEPTWYLFAGSEDEALIWRPGLRTEFGGSASSFALQDRVEIGDLQAGVTYERNGIQASLAYVEREYSVHTGARSFRQEENFAGVTLTMRH
jgi:hypothetical protein